MARLRYRVPSDMAARCYLRPDDDKIEQPKALNAVLYPHQLVVVARMLSMEDKRILELVPDNQFKDITSHNMFIEFNGILLAEKFGSGKTLEILSMILLRPIPKAVPVSRHYHNTSTEYVHFNNEVKRRFTGENALLRPNVIVVGSSVLIQWQRAIEKYTKLRVLTVSCAFTLASFYENFTRNRGWVSNYDIVLIKNGMVTSKFVMPGETPVDMRGIIETVGKITWDCCWARVFYDDYDTIDIPSTAYQLNTLFTVFVSGSRKQSYKFSKTATKYTNIIEAIRVFGSPIIAISFDTFMMNNCAVICDKDFVESSLGVPVINQFRYIYDNPDDVYIGLLGVMRDVDNIIEMLNGDAVETAAETMGIKATNVASIFEKILDQKYAAYMDNQRVLDRIAAAAQEIGALPPHEHNKQHSATKLDRLRSIIAKTEPLPDFKYHSRSAVEMLINMKAEYTDKYNQNRIAIDRVVDNVREGECQVCCLPLNEGGVFIAKCCGLILCEVCGITGCKLSKRYNYKTNQTTLMGKCGNCMSMIDPASDLVFLDKTFDLESLLTARGDEGAEDHDIVEVVPPPKIINPKLRALLSIIRGEKLNEREKISVNIPGLLEGRRDIPCNTDNRTVAIFASYDETLKNIERFLVEHEISFARLDGTASTKAATVAEFAAGEFQVLLINSQHQCAGLDLQFATDLVYFHAVLDMHVMGQIAGRLQRIGRKCNAQFHFLCYPNETIFVNGKK